MAKPSIPVQFEELKSSGDLPSPTGVGMRILELTRTDDYSADDMAEAIMSDPSLTGRILQLANSASVAGTEEVTTVTGAIMRLGGSTVRSLALAFSLVSEREAGACRPFDYERYWSLSLARAVAAQALALTGDLARPEEAYISGLLAEVGMLALASVHSVRYAEILNSTAGKSIEALREAELEAFEIDHAMVAECMLRDWGLPAFFGEGIGDFCCTRTMPAGGAEIASIADLIRFADTIGSAFLLGRATPPRDMSAVGEQLDVLRECLQLDESQLAALCDGIAKEWRRWGEELEIETTDIRFSHVVTEIAAARQRADAGTDAPASIEGAGADVAAGPASPPRAGAPNPAAPLVAREAVGRIRALAVDDEPVSLRLLVRHLRSEGFDVSMARNGKEGLKRALQEKPDLLVVDHEMPDLDGLEVVEALRRSSVGASMYILLLTGTEDEELLIRAFDAGVDDFVRKPFLPRLLSARMKAGVRIANLQRKVERDRKTILEQLADRNMLNRKLRTASLTDPLTGLPNRRHAMNRLESEWKASERTGTPFSLIMMDIDRFKQVNDTYGHDVGDLVLQATAGAVKGALRGEDEACRIGGEEFIVICRNAGAEDGAVVAERIRAAVEQNVVDAPGFGKAVTVSLGVASTGDHGGEFSQESLMALMKGADEAVYQAKNGGRNRVCIAGDGAGSPDEEGELKRSA